MIKILFIPLFITLVYFQSMAQEPQHIEKNGMTVSWCHKDNRIYFSLAAPTTGWIAIGFNTNKNLTNSYLLMARTNENRVEVVEHCVIRPGKYLPIQDLKGKIQIQDVSGSESHAATNISFSLPHEPKGEYQKPLNSSMPYYLTMAFSRSDDFQHHSVMRTSHQIIL